MNKTAFVDVDDLWTPEQIEKYLLPIKAEVPNFLITCYSIPNKLGPVHGLKREFPWITFAIHGWEHTAFECRAWTDEEAEVCISKAIEMGYSKAFKPPNWLYDQDTAIACERLGVLLHHHEKDAPPLFSKLISFPGPIPKRWKGIDMIHSHIQPNPVTDNIETCKKFQIENLKKYETFLSIENIAHRIITED